MSYTAAAQRAGKRATFSCTGKNRSKWFDKCSGLLPISWKMIFLCQECKTEVWKMTELCRLDNQNNMYMQVPLRNSKYHNWGTQYLHLRFHIKYEKQCSSNIIINSGKKKSLSNVSAKRHIHSAFFWSCSFESDARELVRLYGKIRKPPT